MTILHIIMMIHLKVIFFFFFAMTFFAERRSRYIRMNDHINRAGAITLTNVYAYVYI